ncbi:hypothetical protein B4U80_05065, partial [Leptotrombidium deliense]
NDVFVTQKLDKFLKYEMTVEWPKGQPHIEIQCLIAHKDARLLKLWYQSYEEYYSDLWVYNSGILPAQRFIKSNSSLVHLLREEFAVAFHYWSMLFKKNIPERIWRKDYYIFHLFTRFRPYLLNEFTLKFYPTTYGSMAMSILP